MQRKAYEPISLLARLKAILSFSWLGKLRWGRYVIHKNAQKANLVSRLRTWLGPEGLAHLRGIKEKHGRVNAVWIDDTDEDGKVQTELAMAIQTARSGIGIPHVVHFREGMNIRNWLRRQSETELWTDHNYDDRWASLAEEAIE